MQTWFKNNFTKREEGDEFHLGGTIAMILLILVFISSSFYIAITSFI